MLPRWRNWLGEPRSCARAACAHPVSGRSDRFRPAAAGNRGGAGLDAHGVEGLALPEWTLRPPTSPLGFDIGQGGTQLGRPGLPLDPWRTVSGLASPERGAARLHRPDPQKGRTHAAVTAGRRRQAEVAAAGVAAGRRRPPPQPPSRVPPAERPRTGRHRAPSPHHQGTFGPARQKTIRSRKSTVVCLSRSSVVSNIPACTALSHRLADGPVSNFVSISTPERCGAPAAGCAKLDRWCLATLVGIDHVLAAPSDPPACAGQRQPGLQSLTSTSILLLPRPLSAPMTSPRPASVSTSCGGSSVDRVTAVEGEVHAGCAPKCSCFYAEGSRTSREHDDCRNVTMEADLRFSYRSVVWSARRHSPGQMTR
jgi:hypothetical protein